MGDRTLVSEVVEDKGVGTKQSEEMRIKEAYNIIEINLS